MRFTYETKIVLQDSNGNSFTVPALLEHENSIFGICQFRTPDQDYVPETYKWALVHCPSERIVISLFKTRREVEAFVDILVDELDFDTGSLLYLNGNYEEAKNEFFDAINVGYVRFYKSIRRR